MPFVTGNDLLVRSLEAEGVEMVFSIPGGQILGLYEAVRRSPRMDLVVPREEGAGALMACGYALARGGPGVVVSTVGAGVIYELAGVQFAWQEHIPIISIAPQVQSWRIKPPQESLQAMDQDDLYVPITKFRSIAFHARRIPQLVNRAFKSALAPEPGPAHLDIPIDIACERRFIRRSRLENMMPGPGKTRFTGKVHADPSELARARVLLDSAKKPLAVVGRLAARHGTAESVAGFLSRERIPTLASQCALPALPKKTSLSLGTCDLYEDDAAMETFSEADLLVLIEPDAEAGGFAAKVAGHRGQRNAVQVSSHSSHLHQIVPLSCALAGSPGAALDNLTKDALGREGEERRGWCDGLIRLRSRAREKMKALIPEHRGRLLFGAFSGLGRLAGPGDYIVCEGREAVLSAKIFLDAGSPANVIIVPEEAPKGCGFPLALGLKSGAGRARVFLVTDRSGFKCHCRELQTASRYHTGICTLVLPDTASLADTEPDLSALAEALGVKGLRIHGIMEGFTEWLSSASGQDAGFLLEITGDR